MSRYGIALASLVAMSFALHWAVLSASPFPLGVDGYFYPIEVRSLLEHGALQYPASPLTFWWMAPFAALTDPIIGAKLGAALGTALIALPAYGVGVRLGGSRAAGLAAATIAATSAGATYLSIEFVKQGIGLTVALTALWLAMRAIERPSRARIGAAAGAIVAAWLAHKMAAAIVAIALPAAIEHARARGALRGRRLLYVVGGICAAAVIALVLGLVWPERFLSGTDASLLAHGFGRHAYWDAPALVTEHMQLVFGYEPLLGAIAAIAAAAALLVSPPPDRSDRVIAWCVVGLAIAIALPWLAVEDPQGLGFRLRIAAFVPLALCVAIATRWLPGRAQIIACGVLVGALVVHAKQHDRTEGQVLAHPALVASSLAVADYLPSNATAIVPERHIEYMIAWYARAKVAARPESVPYAQRVRVMPLNFIREHSPLEAALDAARAEPTVEPPIGVHPRHPDGMVLVPEATWDWVLDRLPPKLKRFYQAWHTI